MSIFPKSNDLFTAQKEFSFVFSQESAGKYSQMSPPASLVPSSGNSSRRSSFLGIDLPSSSHSLGTYQLPADRGHYSPPAPKNIHDSEAGREFRALSADDPGPLASINLEFDGDGNLVTVIETESELPLLLADDGPVTPMNARGIPPVDTQIRMDVQPAGQDALYFPDIEQPNSPALPLEAARGHPVSGEATKTPEVGRAEMTAPRRGRAKLQDIVQMTDTRLWIPRSEFRDWTIKYAENMRALHDRSRQTSWRKAKKNALAYLWMNGLADVGSWGHRHGVVHPLADDFSGTAFKAHLLGLMAEDIQGLEESRGRRRRSEEAFGDNEQAAQQRNIRQRTEEPELGLGDLEMGDHQPLFGDESVPEVGREGPADIPDHNSSSAMPWSRHGSVAPGSSVKAPGSAQKAMPAPSPLHERRSLLPSIERHSDPLEAPLGIDIASQQSSFDLGPGGYPDFADDGDASLIESLDTPSQQFLGYIKDQGGNPELSGDSETEVRRWVVFEDLAIPNTHSRTVAAQAFLHILSLATKNAISVHQEGLDTATPFGTLRVSVNHGLPAHVIETVEE